MGGKPPAKPLIRLRRVYDPPESGEGMRILVDRLWPRGLAKGKAAIDLWLPDLAPSATLRRAFGHDPARFAAFREAYRAELETKRESGAMAELRHHLAAGPVVLLYAARDPLHNNAAVLAEWLAEKAAPSPAGDGKPGRKTP